MWTEIAARLHLNPGNVLAVEGGTLLAALTCLFCWVRGARADRIGAAVFGACWFGDLVVQYSYLWITGDLRPPMLSDAVWDTIPGVVFLWLAIRHDNLWLGAVALLQGVQFAIDAADHAIGEPVGTPLPVILIVSMDLMNLAMMAAMVGSVVSGRRRRAAALRA
jgi:hypothetical protein